MKAKPEDIRRVLEAWQKQLRLTDWSIDLQVFNESRPTADDGAGKRLATQAEIVVYAGYFRADLKVYTPQIDECELEQVIVHELVHVLLHDLQKMAQVGMGDKYAPLVSDALEQATERVSKALVGLAQARRHLKKEIKRGK